MPGLLPNENAWVDAFAGYQPPQRGLLPQVPDWLRGASYTPLRALGTVTDLGLMLTNALGLTDPQRQYMGSSDWMIDKAADAGLLGRRTGSGSELAGDILGQIAMPGVSPAEMGAYAKAVPYMLGIFGGMGAKTADTDKLAQAFALEQAGKGREEIRQATGWFRAPWDQKWRFEIDDRPAHLLPGPQADIKEGVKYLGKETVTDADIRAMRGLRDNWLFPEFMEHPQAVAAYPKLGTTRVELDASMGAKGSFDSTGRIAFAPTDDLQELRSTMLHEPQHLIQRIEGFASGGNPEMFIPPAHQIAAARKTNDTALIGAKLYDYLRERGIKEIAPGPDWEKTPAYLALKNFARKENISADDAIDGMLHVYQKTGYSKTIPDEDTLSQIYAEANKTYQDLLMQMVDPHTSYMKLAGEAESRLVQQRRNLTATQRGLLDPIEQMDTMLKQEGIAGGLDDLIVRYGDDVAASAPIPDELPFGLPERIQAFRTARSNAALPVEQGGLGLGPANTAAERAGAMQYDTPAFHATTADVDAFDISRASTTAKYGPAVYMGRDPQRMDVITNAVAKRDGGNINVMPLLVNKGNTYDAVTGEYPLSMFMRDPAENPLRALGVDTVEEANALASYDPSRIRSRFAAFDPARRNEADLLASWLLPLAAGGGLFGLGYLGQGEQPIY